MRDQFSCLGPPSLPGSQGEQARKDAPRSPGRLDYGVESMRIFATRDLCMTFQPRRHVTRTPIESELK